MSAVETKNECREALVSLGFHVRPPLDYDNVRYPKGCFAHGDDGQNPYFNVNGNEHDNTATHTHVVCKSNGACGEFYWTTIDSIYLLYPIISYKYLVIEVILIHFNRHSNYLCCSTDNTNP